MALMECKVVTGKHFIEKDSRQIGFTSQNQRSAVETDSDQSCG
jgi:hypothetical protein